jgi:hypothetical protein
MPEKNVESAWLVRLQKDGFGCFFLPMNGTADSSVEFPAVSLFVAGEEVLTLTATKLLINF